MESKHYLKAGTLKRTLTIAGTAVMLSVSSFVLAQSDGGSGSASANGAAKATATTKAGEMKSAPTDMHSAMAASDQQMKSMQSSGNIDRDYAMMMRAHHQGAIDMSNAVLANGKDPEIRRMAKKIASNSKKEISQFDKWLNKQKDTKGTSATGSAAKGTATP